MDRLIKYSLVLICIWLIVRTIIALFFYDQFPIAFLAHELNQEQMDEYRARVIIPAFFITFIYFVYRYLTGKNPTSALWPIYCISFSLLITHLIGFLTFLPFNQGTISMLFLSLFLCFIARKGHNKRKNEIL